MRKPTFEQAMRTTLGNLNITKVIDDELPLELWTAAYLADKKDVDKFLDTFCKDIAYLSNRPIARHSYMDGTFNMVGIRLRVPPEIHHTIIKDYYAKTIKAMDRYINAVIDNLHCLKTNDFCVKPFPFSKIKRFDKKIIATYFPTANEEVKQILLKDPLSKNIEEVEKPRHILEMLEKLKQTHYDYQPYILEDGDEKLLVIRLGNDWNDIAVARWKPEPRVKIDTFLIGLIVSLLSLGSLGIWFNGFPFAGNLTEILIMSFSILFCAASLFFSGLLLVRNNKTFKV